MQRIRWCTRHNSIQANEGTCWQRELDYSDWDGTVEFEWDCVIEPWVATPADDFEGLARAELVALRRIGTKRSTTVREIIAAYLDMADD